MHRILKEFLRLCEIQCSYERKPLQLRCIVIVCEIDHRSFFDHCKGPFIQCCKCTLLLKNCDVTALQCRMKVKFILTLQCGDAAVTCDNKTANTADSPFNFHGKLEDWIQLQLYYEPF